MTTRAECDEFYQKIGLPRFSPEYDSDMVLARASALPESVASHIRRCVALARTTDVNEYFCVSEHATTPEAVDAVIRPQAVSSPPVFLLRWSDNTQYPFALNVIRPGGYCFWKYARLSKYTVTPMRAVASNDRLCHVLRTCVSNLPVDLIDGIISQSPGVLLHMVSFERGEDESYLDVMLCEKQSSFARWVNCLLGMNLRFD